VKEHYKILKTRIDIEIDKIFNIKNYREFDEILTIKLFDFKSVDDYYTKASSYLDVEKLKIPSFFFNSMNDRLSPYHTLNLDSFKNNDNLILLITQNGGHVCWFTGFFNPKRWFIPKIYNYIEALETLNKTSPMINTTNTKAEYLATPIISVNQI